jgi:cytochrome P450
MDDYASLIAPAPSHVDPARIVDYDVLHDRRYAEAGDPHNAIEQLAAEVGRGIFWTQHNGGHWIINDYELLFQAVRDPDLFSSNNRPSGDGAIIMIPPLEGGGEPRFAPVSVDPPEHGMYRMPLMRAFAPAEVLKMESDIRALTIELIERFQPLGQADFLDKVGEPLPVTIFMKMMGMPTERLGEFRSWMTDMASGVTERRNAAFANIDKMMGELIEERQIRPRDDLISRLLDYDIGDRKPTMVDMQACCLLLFTAGLDTVMNALTYGIGHLAKHPDLQDRLRADPSLIPDFIEEELRCFATVMPTRIITRDTDFGGARLNEGDRIVLMLPSGNFDPKVFERPMDFDIDREEKAHLTFNSGPHRCVGSHLARLEMRVFFEEWFARMPNVRLDPTKAATYQTGISLLICSLPIIWDPA